MGKNGSRGVIIRSKQLEELMMTILYGEHSLAELLSRPCNRYYKAVTNKNYYDIMAESQMFMKKHSESPTPMAALSNSKASPDPIGDINVVDTVTVNNDQNLLSNHESVLECLSPLLQQEKRKSLDETPLATCKKRKVLAEAIAQTLDEVDLTGYQEALWEKRFTELIEFREKHGHCLVPHKWAENLALATWVKRQRYQWKLREQGKRSTLTKERRDALTKLGFVWDSHNATWEERYNELAEFKKEHGHTSVPSTYKNHPLSVWVQCQRRQWKLFQEDTESKGTAAYRMKESRVRRLEALGFVWEPRKHQKSK